VDVTEPRHHNTATSVPITCTPLLQVVIYGVSLDVDESEMAHKTNADRASRITTAVDRAQPMIRRPTKTIILNYHDEPPVEVFGYCRYQTDLCVSRVETDALQQLPALWPHHQTLQDPEINVRTLLEGTVPLQSRRHTTLH